jgi:cell division protein ZapA (FtsZ GTPase activity inhibitor)
LIFQLIYFSTVSLTVPDANSARPRKAAAPSPVGVTADRTGISMMAIRTVPPAESIHPYSIRYCMKGSPEANTYTIDINRKKYTFFCTDGEQHVLQIKEKLTRIIDALSEQEPGHMLSNYAMKVALLLADEAVREENARIRQQKAIDEKLRPLIYELDGVIDPG